jgi:hypothetical protein
VPPQGSPAVIAAGCPTSGGAIEREWSRSRRSLDMPLSTAQSLGWSLARTMMTIIVLIETPSGFAVMPLDEFDGDPACILCEYDPFNR